MQQNGKAVLAKMVVLEHSNAQNRTAKRKEKSELEKNFNIFGDKNCDQVLPNTTEVNLDSPTWLVLRIWNLATNN